MTMKPWNKDESEGRMLQKDISLPDAYLTLHLA